MTTTAPRTSTEIIKRLSANGVELASYRFARHPNRKELEAEEAQLKIELLEAMTREAEENMVAQRVEAGRRDRDALARQQRIDAEVKRELGRTA